MFPIHCISYYLAYGKSEQNFLNKSQTKQAQNTASVASQKTSSSSSSSSLTQQPYMGPGLPQKHLLAEVSSGFVTRVFSREGMSAPHPKQ
jgi:hypothetical protein